MRTQIGTVLVAAVLACGGSVQGPLDAAGDTALDAAGDAPVVADRVAPPDVTDAGADAAVTVLRVHYPAGTRRVTIRGSAGPWNWTTGVPARAGADDTWTLTTSAVTAPTEWKPLLDDVTYARGPNYRVAPGQTVDVYPHFVATAGRVVELIPAFHSTALGRDRRVWAYLPVSYGENTRARYPVVYMQDGQNLFDPARAFGGNEWRVDEALDAAAENGSIAEAIVVAPENSSRRIYEYTPTEGGMGGGGGELYVRMLATELKPVVDGMLRTRREREHTGIVGSSLGGLVSVYAGLQRPDVFGLVGALSPSTWWDGGFVLGAVAASRGRTPRALRVYVDSGDTGSGSDDVANTRALAAQFVAAGYVEGADLRHVVQPGATHSEVYWSQRLPGALQFLLGARGP